MNITIQDIFDFVRANPGVHKNLLSIPFDPPILIPAGSLFYNVEILHDIHVHKVAIFMYKKSISLRNLEPKTPVYDPNDHLRVLTWRDMNLEGLHSPRIASELMNRLKKLVS